MPSREPAKHSLTRLTPAPLPQAHLDAAQRLACLRLIRSDNVGPVTFRELINQFGGAVEALDALPELSRRGGRRQALRICPRAEAEAELEAAERIGARPLFTIEPGYPPALAALPRAAAAALREGRGQPPAAADAGHRRGPQRLGGGPEARPPVCRPHRRRRLRHRLRPRPRHRRGRP